MKVRAMTEDKGRDAGRASQVKALPSTGCEQGIGSLKGVRLPAPDQIWRGLQVVCSWQGAVSAACCNGIARAVELQAGKCRQKSGKFVLVKQASYGSADQVDQGEQKTRAGKCSKNHLKLDFLELCT